MLLGAITGGTMSFRAILVLGIAGCAVVMGCGSGDCAQRSGTYSVKYSTRSGNCGAISESVFSRSTQPTSPEPPCTGTIEYSTNNCEVTVNQTCPGTGTSTITMTGVAKWNALGTSATGVFEFSVASSVPSEVCRGTYDAVYTKL